MHSDYFNGLRDDMHPRPPTIEGKVAGLVFTADGGAGQCQQRHVGMGKNSNTDSACFRASSAEESGLKLRRTHPGGIVRE